MSRASPRIGLDRFLDAAWMDMAAAVVRGEMALKALNDRVTGDIPGVQVQRKTLGIINRIWFPEDLGARDLADMAARIATGGAGDRAAAFEAVAIAAYPYFRHILENVGRLLRLQDACSAGEVHRRMFEQHGKRSTIDQATSYGFKTLISWGMLLRSPDKLLRSPPPLVLGPAAKRLLDVAANRSRLSVTPLTASDPLLFPFKMKH